MTSIPKSSLIEGCLKQTVHSCVRTQQQHTHTTLVVSFRAHFRVQWHLFANVLSL